MHEIFVNPRAAARCPLFWLASLCIACVSPHAHALGVYVEQKSFGHSQGVPFGAITQGWDVPVSAGALSQGYVLSEAGIRHAGWTLGIQDRYEARVHYNNDTLEFLQTIKKSQLLTVGRDYTILIDINHYKARGARVSYTFGDANLWHLTLGGTYLELTDLLAGRLEGVATPTSNKSYNFNFDVDYFYTKDALFERKVTAPFGQGYALDLAFYWQALENLALRGEITDLYGKLHWDFAPRTVAKGNSATQKFDSNGYQYFEPAISGRESTEAFDQAFNPHGLFEVEFNYGLLRLNQRTHYTVDALYPALGTAYNWPGWGLAYGYYTLNTGGITLGWRGA
ncbi:MAG: hypothetical protein OEW08_13785, partial [Gammaproteobacteria bacterium]|nr:hypothetical protein [Gammaproteobacteria bacterium]